MNHQVRHTAVAMLITLLSASSSSGSGGGLPAAAPATPVGESRLAQSTNSTRLPAAAPATSVNVTVDVLGDRHAISPYVYGGSYPQERRHDY